MISAKTIQQNQLPSNYVQNLPTLIIARHVSIFLKPTAVADTTSKTTFNLFLNDSIPKKIRLSHMNLVFPQADTSSNASIPWNIQMPNLYDNMNQNGFLTILPANAVLFVNNEFGIEWSNFKNINDVQLISFTPAYTGVAGPVVDNTLFIMNLEFYY